jgi:SAM-dependent methyltransferase
MTDLRLSEHVGCPLCGARQSTPWALERGYSVVRCKCRMLYVNPRPASQSIQNAVVSGFHSDEMGELNVTARRVDVKVAKYQRLLGELLSDVWVKGRPISWLDVGAGYGELVESVSRLAPTGSTVTGLEPMKPKADAARRRNLNVRAEFLHPEMEKVDYVSLIDVFSHIPDFKSLLRDICAVLKPGGELILETGNLADLDDRAEFPGELGLPDHLVFAGYSHLLEYLDSSGFKVVDCRIYRIDGAVNFAKDVLKRILGRPVHLRLPYRSKYRQILLRAHLIK